MRQHQIFLQYANAVNADRYRVTVIKMYDDGRKKTFILDKKNGVTIGFTPHEIEQHTLEMQRLMLRGENIYYTPLSTLKHHILIDDIDRDKLKQLIYDGYQPAVLLESSPLNYQAVITIDKLGTIHDKNVGNRLSDILNREYGDPKLSGAIHPHRAPGYENRKRKYQRDDGSYPEVILCRYERRECGKTLALSSQIDAEYQRLGSLKPHFERSMLKFPLNFAVASSNAINAYQRHYRDVLSRQRGGEVDWSRVDSMIAVRMRVTGHDLAAIAGAIHQCAPTIRPENESRDWSDYAQRTACYAFSAAGDMQVDNLGKYRQLWEIIECNEK